MSEHNRDGTNRKRKERVWKISLNLILTKDQINACSGAVLDCKSLEETTKKGK